MGSLIAQWVTMMAWLNMPARYWALLSMGGIAVDGGDEDHPCDRKERSLMGVLRAPALDVPTLLTSQAQAHWVVWAVEEAQE